MTRILLCCPYELKKTLGGAKVYLEMAQAYRKLGHHCDIVSPDELGEEKITGLSLEDKLQFYPPILRDYLIKQSTNYDIIEYEHEYLPYERKLFDPNTLFVARSILLNHHLGAIKIPRPNTFKSLIGSIIKGPKREAFLKQRIDSSNTTLKNADLINVTNPDDKKMLISYGHDSSKISHFPYGISRERLDDFKILSAKNPAKPVVAFVGSFDYRKGAKEFPEIIEKILQFDPAIKFKLLGTKSMFPDESSVREHFPQKYHSQLIIKPTFDPKELPTLLSDASVGIFPSHLESFGFGVLEMLAAFIPVIAYRVPGPPLMLEDNCLVKSGDTEQMCNKVIQLLSSPDQLYNARAYARSIATSEQFDWELIAKDTIARYQEARLKN